MIALVATVVLPGLFAASGLFAAIVLVNTWRVYGGAWARLKEELAASDSASDSVGPVPVRIVRPANDAVTTVGTPMRGPAAQVHALRPAINRPRVPGRLATLPAAA